MAKSAYSELLRDPRWQKKRLEILQRDDFHCLHCATATETLHVYHKWYVWGRNPWEYPNDALITLCWECHESETEELKSITYDLILVLKKKGYMADDFHRLLDKALEEING